MADTVLRSGLLYGKLPEQKKWIPLYLEATRSFLHMYEGKPRSAQRKGRQLRMLKFGPGDLIGEESSKEKSSFVFFIQQQRTRYNFKVDSSERRGQWIIQLQRSVIGVQHSIQDEQAELAKYRWFWGHIERADCEKKLQTEGSEGNFVISIDDDGYYVISYLHSSGINHSRIIQDGNLFYFESSVTKFESSPVFADGSNLIEFLASYISMRMRAAINIVPLGGSLHQTTSHTAGQPPGHVQQASALTSQVGQFLTPQVKQKPLHVVQSGIPKAESLQHLSTFTSTHPYSSSAKQFNENGSQQKHPLARVQSLMTPPVKHKSLHAVVKTDVHRAASLQQLPSQKHISMLLKEDPQRASFHIPSSTYPAATQEQPSHAVKFDVHRAMSFDQLPSYSTRSEQAKNRSHSLVNDHLQQGQSAVGVLSYQSTTTKT